MYTCFDVLGSSRKNAFGGWSNAEGKQTDSEAGNSSTRHTSFERVDPIPDRREVDLVEQTHNDQDDFRSEQFKL